MRVSIDWLREWVDVGLEPDGIAARLTTAGLEVDAVEPVSSGAPGVVVGRVLELKPHPNADRLSVCTVDDGSSQHDVVCGAPNVAAGITVPFAPVGASLPGGQQIAAATLRGTTSNGMLCSARELGLHEDVDGLLILDADAEPGTPIDAHLHLDDYVIDIDITPNRGDCFSVLGIARELALITKQPLRGPEESAAAVGCDDRFPVRLAPGSGCPRFAGRVIRGLATNARSPVWMRERLHRAGLRPIHPVVDVTNYVMLELGQPLHAYRLDRLAEAIDVRRARPGESLTLLDGRTVDLDDDTLVIADASGPVGMAGIMGGDKTGVDAGTADVFLEAAFFIPDAILGRARRYGLHTDASLRFERGVDFDLPRRALERATVLLQHIAGGDAGPIDICELPDELPARLPISLRPARVGALLGAAIDPDEIEQLLQALGVNVEQGEPAWRATPPTYRFDLNIEEDLIEEVGRSYGYDRIPAVPGAGPAHLGAAAENRVAPDRVADALVARGYMEVISYSFISPAAAAAVDPDVPRIELANPISADLSVMRQSLWPGLLDAARQNLSRQQTRIRMFEQGRQFNAVEGGVEEVDVTAGIAIGPRWPEHWDAPEVDVDFFDVKGDVEALLEMTGRAGTLRFTPGTHPALLPGQTARIVIDGQFAGWLGRAHPHVQKAFDLKQPAILFALHCADAFAAAVPASRPVSRFPSVRRDLAIVVDEDVSVEKIRDYVQSAGGERLRAIRVFDLYRGKGVESSRKSIGLGLILQDASRTLTDDDADGTVQSVTQILEQKLGATIRT